MKTLNRFITEKLKITKDTQIISDLLSIKDDSGNNIDIKKSKNEYKNQCFEWISKHCIVPTGLEDFNLNVDNFIAKSTKYEIKNNFSAIVYLINKDIFNDLGDSYNIKYKRTYLKNKYMNDEWDGIIGYINILMNASQRNQFKKRGVPSVNQRKLDDIYDKINDKIYGDENEIIFIPQSTKTFSEYGVLWSFVPDYPFPLQKNHPNKA